MLYNHEQPRDCSEFFSGHSCSEFYNNFNTYNLHEIPQNILYKHEDSEIITIVFDPLPGFHFGMCGPTLVKNDCKSSFAFDMELIFFILILDGTYHIKFGDNGDFSVDIDKGKFLIADCENITLHSFLKKQKNLCSVCFTIEKKFLATYFGTQVKNLLLERLHAQKTTNQYPIMVSNATLDLQNLGRFMFRVEKTDIVNIANLRANAMAMFSKVLHTISYSKYAQDIVYDNDLLLIAKMKKMVEMNVIENNNAKYLCSKTCFSLAKANKLFREIYGVTLPCYIHNCKLDHAYTLMHTHKCNVTECAFEVGYSSIGHFIAAFKKRFQCTPGELLRDVHKSE